MGLGPRSGRRSLAGIEQRLLARFRRLPWPADPLLAVGFSGGADSLALAAMLRRLAETVPLRLLLIHVDHALRPASAGEQDRAAELAAALGMAFTGRRVEDEPRRLHPGVGLEEAARRERYRLLAEVVAESGACGVALAHHGADQAETTLLHLLRGAGLAGAAAMAETTMRPVPWWGGTGVRTDLLVWRPLLGESRPAVREYAAGLGLVPVADPSNDEREARRNAVRHDVLPLLERIVPGAGAALARYAGLAAADDAALEAWAAAVAARTVDGDGALRPGAMGAEPIAIRRRVVRGWLRDRLGQAPPSDRVEAVLGLIEPPGGGRRIEVGGGGAVVSARDRLWVELGLNAGEDRRA